MGGLLQGWQTLLPIALLACAAMAVLVLEAVLAPARPAGEATQRPAPRRRLGLLFAFVATLSLASTLIISQGWLGASGLVGYPGGAPMLRLDGLAGAGIAVVSFGALLTVWLSSTYLIALRIDHGEYYALILLSVAGMVAAVAAQHWMALFVALELMTNPVYALAAFDRAKLRSNEAGLKYFVLGTSASAILLYGIAFLYGASGRLDYAGVRAAMDVGDPLAMAGLALLLVGAAFKIALAPFHQWAPDVYEGAPTPVTAFMATCVKTTAVIVLLRIVLEVLPAMTDVLRPVFSVLALASIVVGSLMAIIQSNVKRMLAYSSVVHAGYLTIAFVSATPDAWAALLYYLLIYVVMTMGAFGVIVALTAGGRDCERIDDFAGIARARPGLAAALTLFVLALAGLPGTAGFFAKFHLLRAAIGADEIGLAIVAVLASAVSLYYYLRLPIAMYMREPSAETGGDASTSEWGVLGVCAFLVLWLGFFPNAALPWFDVGLLDLCVEVIGAAP